MTGTANVAQPDLVPQPQPAAEPVQAGPVWLRFVEAFGVVGLLAADWFGLVPLSRTPFLLLICWLSLRVRRLRWRSVGLYRPERFARAVGIGALAGVGMELFALFVTIPIIARVTGAPPDVSEWRGVIGNLPVLLLLVALSWVLAAFGEEIAFRGYLMTRIRDMLGGFRGAWVAALLVASVVFGIGHATQGWAGVVQESFAGLVLGVMFLAAGRNLTIPIVAHGVANTLAFVLIFLGRYPGMG